ncbi:MAG TPA: UbiA family prenyltransferase [Geobacterales bacterium]|nr:UbiA family prenyltransferase [Geobacterales bacterium]
MSTKLKGALKIIRIPNSIMMGIGVLVGLQISNHNWYSVPLSSLFGEVLGVSNLLLPFLVGFFLSASSMALNDYVDYEIDAINFPKKPIPAGLITRSFAFYYAILLAVMGIIIALSLLNPISIAIAFSGIIVAYLYNFLLKRRGLLGNIAVAYTTTLPFIYGASLVGMNNFFTIMILCILSFLSNLSREIVKGIVDIVGDRAIGIKTIANTKGPDFASKLAFVFIAIAVALSFTPFILGYLNIYFIPLLILADFIFMYYSYLVLKKPEKNQAYITKNRYLFAMFLSLLCFFLASI